MGTRYRCTDCGYMGRPATLACHCAQNLARTIDIDESTLKTYPTDAVWPSDWKTSREQLAREVREMKRVLPRVGRCAGEGRGQPAIATRTFGFSGHCIHTYATCPLCL